MVQKLLQDSNMDQLVKNLEGLNLFVNGDLEEKNPKNPDQNNLKKTLRHSHNNGSATQRPEKIF